MPRHRRARSGDDAQLDAHLRPAAVARRRRARAAPAPARPEDLFSLHAPEVECIGKGKAHQPYEFGVKVSVATTLQRSKGGQFIAH